MTWLGKTLAFVVLVLSLVWMYMTANAYATRTNWKTEADKWKAAYTEALKAREAEHRIYQTAESAYAAKYAAERTAVAAVTANNTKLLKANTDNIASQKTLADAIVESDIKAVQLGANLTNALSNENTLRQQADKLQVERNKLVLDIEQAKQDRQLAVNDLRLAVARQEEAERRFEAANSNLQELLAQGARLVPGGGRAAPSAAEGTRGTVTEVSKDLVTLSIGLDAGLQPGVTLDLMRMEGGGKYLGTVVIQQGGLTTKQSVGAFKPADPTRPLERLRPDERPKVGDVVGKVDTTRASNNR